MGRKRWKPQRQVSLESGEEFDPAVVAEVESLFKRQFEYARPSEGAWRLPPIESWLPGQSWTDEVLQTCKNELNEVKCSLSDYDINKWQEHTSATNRAGLVMSYLRRHRKPELCTQAWCKFHEIVHSFPLLPGPTEADHLTTVHLCEAPGAFVSSLNHYILSKGYFCNWQWQASTLNPYYEGNSPSHMISEDSFIRETLDHWEFGADDTGDIMSVQNILHLRTTAGEGGPVQLVTADGSIDCQNDPGEQEDITASLHLAEVVAALHVLSTGGSLVLKMFTLFESCSVSLLYLLNCAFNRVCVCKPATSKSGNSEVYVVGLDYKGMTEEQLVILRSAIGGQAVTLFSLEDLPGDFVSQHRQCVQLFVKLQLQTIQENKQLHGNMSPETQLRIEQARKCCALSYMTRFHVKTIPHWQYIVDSGKEKFHKSWQGKKTRVQRHIGSFNDRQKDLSLSWSERLRTLEAFAVEEPFVCVFEGSLTLSAELISQWAIATGKSYDQIKSSKFCDSCVLQRYLTLMNHSQESLSGGLPSVPDLKAAIDQMAFHKDSSFMSTDDQELLDSFPVLSLGESQMDSVIVTVLRDVFGEKISMVTADDRDHVDQVLLIPEMQSENSSKNNDVQGRMLDQLCSIVQKSEEGDHCIFPIYESITRFSAAIVFVLQGLFTKLMVLPSSSGCSPYLIVCSSLRCPPPDLLTFLSKVKVTQETVLQFVPIHCLCENKFFKFISHVNNEMLKRASNYLLSQERQQMLLMETSPPVDCDQV